VGGEPVNDMVSPEQPQTGWPVETDLIFVQGTKKVMLTIQRPLMRSVIQDSFERIRASLVFNDAFPDAFSALDITRDSLILAAEFHDRATDIHNRLLLDTEYMNKMTHLVSFRS
jgi:hypothetical protein